MRIYVIDVEYNPTMFSVKIVKETPKTFQVDKDTKKILYGNYAYCSGRIYKPEAFKDFASAKAELLKRLKEKERCLKEKIDRVNDDINKLEKLGE